MGGELVIKLGAGVGVFLLFWRAWWGAQPSPAASSQQFCLMDRQLLTMRDESRRRISDKCRMRNLAVQSPRTCKSGSGRDDQAAVALVLARTWLLSLSYFCKVG